VDHDGDAAGAEGEAARGLLVEDLVHRLDLDEVVARPQGAELGGSPLQRLGRDAAGIGPGEAPALFRALQVGPVAVSPVHHPAGTLQQHRLQLAVLQGEGAAGAHTAGDGGEESVQQRLQLRQEFRLAQGGHEKPHAAGDVVPHSSRGEDALFGVEGGHAADGKAVSPVDVRHGDALPHDARQGCHVHNLGEGVFLKDGLQDVLVREEQPGDAHVLPGAPGQGPAQAVIALQQGSHGISPPHVTR
jgi:hypothetical protein